MDQLWNDMYARGVGGDWFDTLRSIYARMEYVTANAGDDRFHSGVGLLTGDSLSPGLYNIRSARYSMPSSPANVRLHGLEVSWLRLADDELNGTTAFAELQRQADTFESNSDEQRAHINIPKSHFMIHGPLPSPIPSLRVAGQPIALSKESKFAGVWISSVSANIFEPNYSIYAGKARNAANTIFSVRHRTGQIPVDVGINLYNARVDCYLIRAADIAIDVDGLVHMLEEVQRDFLRRLLGVGSRSLLAPLFTETGVMPIRYRRLILALKRVRYLTKLDFDRIPHRAFRDSIDLWQEGKPCWIADIAIALNSLPTPIITSPADFMHERNVDDLIQEVTRVVDQDLQRQIDESPKCRLLWGRLESVGDRKLGPVARRRRHYLTMVANADHRIALTRLIFSNHCLSIELLRYPTRYRAAIPRDMRLCRFCLASVEDEPHALLGCEADLTLRDLRDAFLREVFAADSSLRTKYALESDLEFLRSLLASRKTIVRFAKFVHDVLHRFRCLPAFVPNGFNFH
ncbi:Reverse transcriptase domain-containing protein [Mycena kentingensis (nom. inval.)]|nr:Reverse transcriptase domain-containing protein [Mycena kentingensis (nom. inval.)]